MDDKSPDKGRDLGKVLLGSIAGVIFGLLSTTLVASIQFWQRFTIAEARIRVLTLAVDDHVKRLSVCEPRNVEQEYTDNLIKERVRLLERQRYQEER